LFFYFYNRSNIPESPKAYLEDNINFIIEKQRKQKAKNRQDDDDDDDDDQNDDVDDKLGSPMLKHSIEPFSSTVDNEMKDNSGSSVADHEEDQMEEYAIAKVPFASIGLEREKPTAVRNSPLTFDVPVESEIGGGASGARGSSESPPSELVSHGEVSYEEINEIAWLTLCTNFKFINMSVM
jgi:hypothetical protein